jgi:hypothetical protein
MAQMSMDEVRVAASAEAPLHAADAMRTVLYLVETPGQFTELERLTRLLGQHRSVRQVYLVYDGGDASRSILERIDAAGAECANASPSSTSKALRSAVRVPLGLGRIVDCLRSLIHLPVFAAKYRRLLQERKIDLVVVAEDSVSGRSRALVAAAERLRIPVMLVPFTIVNPEEAASTIRQLPSHRLRRFDQRAFAALRPRWVRKDDGVDLLRLPLGRAVMLELAGLAPPDPWIENRGYAVIAAESRAMKRRYLALGIPPEQIPLTGSLVDPVLEDSVRRRDELRAGLRRRFGLPDKPLLLCALPPDQFRLGPPAACAYASYPQLLADWLSSLKAVADKLAVVVRPHPRMAEASLAQLDACGIAVTWDDTALLIPLCDLYVASSSATIRWAIACGRPALNYDVYRYGYDDYAGVAGVLQVDDARTFDATLGELASNTARLQTLADAQAAVAAEWGCLDGGSEGRMLALYDRILVQN